MSKFDKIFETRNNSSGTKEAKATELEAAETTSKNSNQNNSWTEQTNSKLTKETSNIVSTHKKLGRPATGKKNDPMYVGFTTYIRRDTHTAVKIRLLQEGEKRELSELVEELLHQWTMG